VLKNWKDIAIALALAILTWYLLTGREKVEAWVDMSVEMTNAPKDLTIRKGLVSKIEVRVRGPKGLVRSLDRRKWTYSLDVSRLKVGENLVDIDRERIPLSMAYEVVEVKPSRLILTVDRLTRKDVPVVAEWRGALRPDYHLLEIKTQPETVEVRGAERQVKLMTQARVAVQMDFDDPPATWTDDVPIKLADGVEANPGAVKVTMRFGPDVKTAWVRVPVRVESGQGQQGQSAQKHLRVQVEGPVPMLREAEAGRDIQGVDQPTARRPVIPAYLHLILERAGGFVNLLRSPQMFVLVTHIAARDHDPLPHLEIPHVLDGNLIRVGDRHRSGGKLRARSAHIAGVNPTGPFLSQRRQHQRQTETEYEQAVRAFRHWSPPKSDPACYEQPYQISSISSRTIATQRARRDGSPCTVSTSLR